MERPAFSAPPQGQRRTNTRCLKKKCSPEMWSKIGADHEVLKKPNLSRGCERKGQKGATLVGLAAAPPLVMRTCTHNAAAAACGRHLAERSEPEPARLTEMHSVADTIIPKVRQRYVELREDWSWDRWMHRWEPAKQKAVLEALLDAVTETPEELMADAERFASGKKGRKAIPNPRVSWLTSMVKREVMVGYESESLLLEPKIPTKARLIHFYKFLDAQEKFARHHLAMQKAITDILDGGDVVLPGTELYMTVASSMNSVAKGAWVQEVEEAYGGNLTWYERDGKSWDATMGAGHFSLQERLVELCAEPDFLEHIRETKTCVCDYRSRGASATARDYDERFKYKISYTTKSGHNDTSWRNSWINAIITLSALRETNHLRARAIVIGDDLLVGVDGPVDVDALRDYEKSCGIKPEADKIKKTSLVEFASDVFVPAVVNGKRQYVAVPKLGKLLAKLFWTHTSVPDKRTNDFRFSIAYGMRNTLSRAPLYGPFLQANMAGGGTFRQVSRWFRDAEEIIDYDPREFNAWLNERYGITSEQVSELESLFDEHAGKIGILCHPLIDHIIAVDIADPGTRSQI